MTLLHNLSYIAAVAAFLFITLSLASGLLYLAEVIEEHSKLAKIIGQRAVYVIILLHVLLYAFDSLPLTHIVFSIVCHLVYLQNFSSTWPYISLTSVTFLASCALVVADHFLWFFYFANKTQEARRRAAHRYRDDPLDSPPGFIDIATFFGTCVWLVPLFLFLSLSANDNALPMTTGEPGTPTRGSIDLTSRPPSLPITRSSLFKSILDPIVSIIPWHRLRRGRGRQNTEGIIAPRSPVTRSPVPSPGPGSSWTLAGDGPNSRPPSPGWLNQTGEPRRAPSTVKLANPPPPMRRATMEGLGIGSTLRRSEDGGESGRLTIRPNSRLGKRLD